MGYKEVKIAIIMFLMLLMANADFVSSKNFSLRENKLPLSELCLQNSPHLICQIEEIINELPGGECWIDHIEHDIMGFWTKEAAQPKKNKYYTGKFPTYRCNNGQEPDSDKLCPEYQAALSDSELRELIKLDRNYARAQSRQIYGYGIAYHMTGKIEYLEAAKAGVDYLINNYLEKLSGGEICAASYLIEKEKEPKLKQRTSQDMAYALTGIGFYYYLTLDKEVLNNYIIPLKDYIFKTYLDDELGMFKYVLEESPDRERPDQKELVAQLDQVYAYMLWLTPSLPTELQIEWKGNLHDIASLMIKHFFSPQQGFFWGAVTNPGVKSLGTPHTDFGHTIKTLWLIYQIGKLTDDIALVNFSAREATKILELAYHEESGSWARRFDERGQLDTNKEWWILAELDQTAATLSLVDPSYARYLVNTYDYWLKYMVDQENKGIWHMVSGLSNKRVLKYPKQHSWKNCLHSCEHALVSYLTTQQLKGADITLYYAFKKQKKSDGTDKEFKDYRPFVHPYFYRAKIVNEKGGTKYPMQRKLMGGKGDWLKNYTKYEVKMTDLH